MAWLVVLLFAVAAAVVAVLVPGRLGGVERTRGFRIAELLGVISAVAGTYADTVAAFLIGFGHDVSRGFLPDWLAFLAIWGLALLAALASVVLAVRHRSAALLPLAPWFGMLLAVVILEFDAKTVPSFDGPL